MSTVAQAFTPAPAPGVNPAVDVQRQGTPAARDPAAHANPRDRLSPSDSAFAQARRQKHGGRRASHHPPLRPRILPAIPTSAIFTDPSVKLPPVLVNTAGGSIATAHFVPRLPGLDSLSLTPQIGGPPAAAVPVSSLISQPALFPATQPATGTSAVGGQQQAVSHTPFVGADRTGRKARRRRTTATQLAELTKVFAKNDYPDNALREELSKKTGMTNREIQVWFQNRRQKESNVERRQEAIRRSSLVSGASSSAGQAERTAEPGCSVAVASGARVAPAAGGRPPPHIVPKPSDESPVPLGPLQQLAAACAVGSRPGPSTAHANPLLPNNWPSCPQMLETAAGSQQGQQGPGLSTAGAVNNSAGDVGTQHLPRKMSLNMITLDGRTFFMAEPAAPTTVPVGRQAQTAIVGLPAGGNQVAGVGALPQALANPFTTAFPGITPLAQVVQQQQEQFLLVPAYQTSPGLVTVVGNPGSAGVGPVAYQPAGVQQAARASGHPQYLSGAAVISAPPGEPGVQQFQVFRPQPTQQPTVIFQAPAQLAGGFGGSTVQPVHVDYLPAAVGPVAMAANVVADAAPGPVLVSGGYFAAVSGTLPANTPVIATACRHTDGRTRA